MAIKQDYKAYGLNPLGLLLGLITLHTFWLVALYRLSNWFYRKGTPIIPFIIKGIGVVLYSADISPSAKIGPGFRIAHSVGIVVGENVVVGSNFELFHNTTLGGRDKELQGRKMPIVGDNVTVFAGATVLGPIMLGDNVSVGSNSVVTRDFTDNVIIAGIPAKVIGEVDKPHSLRSMG